MRERKLRSAAESLMRLTGSFISYTYTVYKIKRKVKEKKHNANLLSERPWLKHEWNHTVGSVNNLRCGIAGQKVRFRSWQVAVTASLAAALETVAGKRLIARHSLPPNASVTRGSLNDRPLRSVLLSPRWRLL